MTTATSALAQPRLRLRTPDDLLAGTPYLFGFHPSDSIVILGVRGRRLRFHMRDDLPAAGTDLGALADSYGAMFQRQHVDHVVPIAYGPPSHVEPLLLAIAAAMRRRRVGVHQALWAFQGRYRSMTCEKAGCCPAEGQPYDSAGSAVAATATFNGMVALPHRDVLVDSLAAPTGAALDVAERAAQARLASGPPTDGPALLATAIRRHRHGGQLTDDEVASVAVLVHDFALRDEAWTRIDRDGDPEVHERLWTDVLRRCLPELAAPAGMLVAYAAWRAGNGVRSRIAIERALAADPDYRAAKLMTEILDRGLSPRSMPPLARPDRRPARARRHAERRRRR